LDGSPFHRRAETVGFFASRAFSGPVVSLVYKLHGGLVGAIGCRRPIPDNTMATRTPDLDAEAPQGVADEDEQGFDMEQAKELAGFFLRSPRRRPRVAVATFAGVILLTTVIALFWPRSYRCDMRILAQKNLVLPALGNPGRQIPRDADNPTKNVAETILQRDNIVALIKGVDLIDRWGTTRQPVLRLKDRIFTALFGPVPEDDQLRSFVGLLQQRLTVFIDDSSINISIDWPDAEMAFEIVSLVQKNFYEARYDADVNVIVEAIRILEERAKDEASHVDSALADVTKLEADRHHTPVTADAPLLPAQQAPRSSATSDTSRPTPPTAPPGTRDVATVSEDAKHLEDVRRRIRDIEDDHRKRIAETESQLAEARLTLGPLHPTVVALNQKLDQLKVPPPDLAPLKADERALVGRLAAGAQAVPQVDPNPPAAPTSAISTPRRVAALPRDAATTSDRDDTPTAVARGKLQAESAKYADLLSRIESARIELDITRAAFKYQYTVVWPAELPRKPRTPKVPLVVMGGLIAAFILAALFSGGLDLIRGRFVEPWQVRRKLKLPVLGELTPPPPS
jgi:uncharacterized protein involved in exopolysaccharide biosynthesis